MTSPIKNKQLAKHFNNSFSLNKSPSSNAEVPTPLLTTPNSFQIQPRKKGFKTELISICWNELEYQLEQFLRTIFQQKNINQTDFSSYMNYLKKIIEGIRREVPEPSLEKSDVPRSGKGYGLNSTFENLDLERRVSELEDEKAIYEQKLKKHAVYTSELEEKVNKLIEDYQRVLIKCEELTEELDLSRGKTPVRAKSPTIVAAEQIGNLIENEERLYEENIMLKNELKLIKQKVMQIENGQLLIESTSDCSPKSQRKSLDGSRKSPNSLSPTRTKSKDNFEEEFQRIQGENAILTDSLKQQDYVMQEMQKQITIIQEENIALTQRLREIEESLGSQLTTCLEKIELLTNELEEAEQNLNISNKKCEHLQRLVQSKTEMEALLKSRSEIIEKLEDKLEGLIDENNYLRKIHDEKAIVSQNTKSPKHNSASPQSSKHSTSKSFAIITKQLFNSNLNKDADILEKRKRLESHRLSPETPGERTKVLTETNSKLSSDLQKLQNEFMAYKETVSLMTTELKSYFDVYKKYDSEIDKKLPQLGVGNIQDIIRFKNLYNQARREILQKLEHIEAKQKLL